MLHVHGMIKMNKNEQSLKSAGNGPKSFGTCLHWYQQCSCTVWDNLYVQNRHKQLVSNLSQNRPQSIQIFGDKSGTSIMDPKQVLCRQISVASHVYWWYLGAVLNRSLKYAPCSWNEQNEQKWTNFKKCLKCPKIVRYVFALIPTMFLHSLGQIGCPEPP